MDQEEEHPWKWFAPTGCKILIIGTFPPTRRNWKYDFFYPNPANFFWKIIATIANRPLQYFEGEEAVAERKKLLAALGIAITDMGLRIKRHDNSSLDENLVAVEFMDIFQILEENPAIQKIIFTSSSGKSSAASWFIQFLKTKKIRHQFPKGNKPLSSRFQFSNRLIELHILHSPSARAANRISFGALTGMYRDVIVLPANKSL